jgi:DNA-binding MarR family transcriptional regulator
VSEWSVRVRATERDKRGPDPAAESDGQVFVIEDSLGYLVNRVARSMAHQLAEDLRPAGVGIGQWAVLMFLWARDRMSQAELSRVVAIEPPTMVRTIDRMVRDGVVIRVPDPDDGRVTRIHRTGRGRSLRDELVPKAVAVNTRALSRMTDSEGRTLRRLLDKLLVEDDSVIGRIAVHDDPDRRDRLRE